MNVMNDLMGDRRFDDHLRHLKVAKKSRYSNLSVAGRWIQTNRAEAIAGSAAKKNDDVVLSFHVGKIFLPQSFQPCFQPIVVASVHNYILRVEGR